MLNIRCVHVQKNYNIAIPLKINSKNYNDDKSFWLWPPSTKGSRKTKSGRTLQSNSILSFVLRLLSETELLANSSVVIANAGVCVCYMHLIASTPPGGACKTQRQQTWPENSSTWEVCILKLTWLYRGNHSPQQIKWQAITWQGYNGDEFSWPAGTHCSNQSQKHCFSLVTNPPFCLKKTHHI